MIDFHLAKRLAEAGYPQNKHGHAIDEDGYHVTFGGVIVPGFYHIPKLNKLIEACGDGFASLYKHDDGTWTAEVPDWRGIYPVVDTKGSTPDEAVANLYIALNQK